MMTRVLLALAFTFTLSAEPNAVPLPRLDGHATSATNGDSTLVVWTNMWGVYKNFWRIYMRLTDSPFDANAIQLGYGVSPRVATNGRQYLAGYTYAPSRFGAPTPLDNAFLQLVSPQGVKIGPPLAINGPVGGRLEGIGWNGTHWLVAYVTYDTSTSFTTHVAFLDESLDIAADLQFGAVATRALAQIDGRWWVFSSDASSLQATELRPDGTAGAHFSTAPLESTASNVQLTYGTSPLLLIQDFAVNGVDAIPFDPFTGFGERRTLFENTTLLDVEPFDGGSLVLLTSSDMHYDTVFVSATGEVSPRLTLLVASEYGIYSLGSSKKGTLLFATPETNFDIGELYAYRITLARALDWTSEQLISQVTVPSRRRGAQH